MTRYYEDMTPGEVIDFGRHTMKQADMIAFAEQWDPRPFHVDPAFARASIYGSLTASGIHTLAVLIRLGCAVTLDWAIRGALGYDSLRFPSAVRDGDVLIARSEILDKRVSNSRPGLGIIHSRDTLTKENGEQALELVVAYLMALRAA